jgi:serine/threonine protein kinase
VVRDYRPSLLAVPGPLPDVYPNHIVVHSQWQAETEIGQGAYARVMRADMDGRKVAVKELKSGVLGGRAVLGLRREVDALRVLRHPNILQFVGVTLRAPFCIVTACVDGRSLFDLLHRNEGWPMPGPTERMRIAIGMARGLEYLSVMRLLHRDFKSQNVLVDQQFNAVICDFGLARTRGRRMSMELGTVQWAAPEVMLPGKPDYDCGVDTYSMAIVLWELATLALPYKGTRATVVAVQVCHSGLRPAMPDFVPEPLADLIRGMWDQNPRNRPPIEEVRRRLESGRVLIQGSNARDVLAWVAETLPTHERALEEGRQAVARADTAVFGRLHRVRVLDPLIVQMLEEVEPKLRSGPFDEGVFKDLFRIFNQEEAPRVAERALELLHIALRRALDPRLEVKPDLSRLVYDVLPAFENHAHDTIGMVQILVRSIDVEQLDAIIAAVLALPHKYATVEMIEILLEPAVGSISEERVLQFIDAIEPEWRAPVFRVALAHFGLVPALIPVACSTLPLLEVLIRQLVVICDASPSDALAYMGLGGQMAERDVRESLDGVARAVLHPTWASETTNGQCLIMINFLIPLCARVGQNQVVAALLFICAKLPAIGEYINQNAEGYLPFVLFAVDFPDLLECALKMLELMPPPEQYRERVFATCIGLYSQSKDVRVCHLIKFLLRAGIGFPVADLMPVIREGIESGDEMFAATALRIATALDPSRMKEIASAEGFANFAARIQRDEFTVARWIGKFLYKLWIRVTAMRVECSFVETVLAMMFNVETPFMASVGFFYWLTVASRDRKVGLMLQRLPFRGCLEMLAQRYRDSPKLAKAKEFVDGGIRPWPEDDVVEEMLDV